LNILSHRQLQSTSHITISMTIISMIIHFITIFTIQMTTALRVPQSAIILPQKGPTSEMDVVMLLHKFDCVADAAIKHLNMYVAPRRILVVTNAAFCSEISDVTATANVKCLDEDKVLPNITKHFLDQKICMLRGIRDCRKESAKSEGWGGHSRAGWYLQQFIKLGISDSPLLRGEDALSETYLVMDADMIPFSNLAVRNEHGQMPLMAGGPQHGSTHAIAFNKVEEGQCDYDYAYKSLTGENLQNPKSPGHGYVPHHMVMQQEFVKEMLAAFSQQSKTEKENSFISDSNIVSKSWTDEVLDVSCGNGRSEAECSCGFSEYASYASWMKSHHIDLVYDLPELFERRHGGKHCCLDEQDEQMIRTNKKWALVLEAGGC
jgi:hypothetical protein